MEYSDVQNLNQQQSKYFSRILEFCSTSPKGIELLTEHQQCTFNILEQLIQPYQDEQTVLYAAATVLLDLTANEACVEGVA